jgi:hypothetical protein
VIRGFEENVPDLALPVRRIAEPCVLAINLQYAS